MIALRCKVRRSRKTAVLSICRRCLSARRVFTSSLHAFVRARPLQYRADVCTSAGVLGCSKMSWGDREEVAWVARGGGFQSGAPHGSVSVSTKWKQQRCPWEAILGAKFRAPRFFHFPTTFVASQSGQLEGRCGPVASAGRPQDPGIWTGPFPLNGNARPCRLPLAMNRQFRGPGVGGFQSRAHTGPFPLNGNGRGRDSGMVRNAFDSARKC